MWLVPRLGGSLATSSHQSSRLKCRMCLTNLPAEGHVPAPNRPPLDVSSGYIRRIRSGNGRTATVCHSQIRPKSGGCSNPKRDSVRALCVISHSAGLHGAGYEQESKCYAGSGSILRSVQVSHERDHVRGFSIMERYRRAREIALNKDSSFVDTANRIEDQLELVPDDDDVPGRRRKPSVRAIITPEERRTYHPSVRATVPAEAQFATWEKPVQPENPMSLKVALIGPPNAGKSSLLNSLLGATVSAVSNKVNTTRSDFQGIVTKGNRQLVFIDAPGIIESHPQKFFCKDLVNAAWRGYEDADLGILVVDAVKRPTQNVFNVVRAIAPKPSLARFGFRNQGGEWLSATHNNAEVDAAEVPSLPSPMEMRKAGIAGTVQQRLIGKVETDSGRRIPIVLCLNKIDLASHPKWIHARTNEFLSHGRFQNVFHVSAKYRRGTDSLLEYLINKAVPRPWTYPSDVRTNLSKVQQVEELIRTYIFCWFNKDVPYRVGQQTVGWQCRPDGSVVIEQEILVRTDKVAKMICGIRGRILLQLRKNVAYKLEQLWGHKVLLNVYVKALQHKA